MMIVETDSISNGIQHGISTECIVCQFGIILKFQCHFGIE